MHIVLSVSKSVEIQSRKAAGLYRGAGVGHNGMEFHLLA